MASADGHTRRRCEDCRWWDNSTKHGTDDQDITGLCRVLPPRLDKRSGLACWPFTEDTDWCGRFDAARAPGETSLGD